MTRHVTAPGGRTIINVTHRRVRTPSDIAEARQNGRPTGEGGFPFGSGRVGPAWQPGMNRQNDPSDFGDHPGGTVSIVVHGPFFGDVGALIGALIDELTYAIAAQGLSNVQFNLDRSIQFPTPYYETQVMLERVGTDMVVHDRGIIYGPWLEGVSERNRTTRFKGYHSFVRAYQQLQGEADAIGQRVAAEFIGRELN